MPYRPGVGPLPGFGSPFRAVIAGRSQPGSRGPGADALGGAAPGAAGVGVGSGVPADSAQAPGAGSKAAAEANLGHPVAAEALSPDGRPDSEDDSEPWEVDEVMVLLLAMMLPVLCALAAAFAVRGRRP